MYGIPKLTFMRKLLFILHLMLFTNLIYGQVTEGLVGYFPFTNGSFSDLSGYQDCVFSSNGDSTHYLIEDRFGNLDQAIKFQADEQVVTGKMVLMR